VLALMNPGGVRNPGFLFAGSQVGEGDGNVTYGEAFQVRHLTLEVAGNTETLVEDGVVQNPARPWRVTNFMADGGDAFGVLKGGTDRLGGAQDIDALASDLGGYLSPSAPYDPNDVKLGKPRIRRLDGGTVCP
jgi:5'-nucleotidase